MAKNPNKKVKRGESMSGAMTFFLAGCVAELYLLLVQRYYIKGTIGEMLAWDEYLKTFALAGAVVLAVGAVLSYLWKAAPKKRVIGWVIGGAGLFVAAVSLLARWNMSSVTLLNVLVPAVMLLGIVWCLYDRHSALTITVLGVSVVATWICRRQASSMYVGTLVMVLAIVYVALLIALALMVKKGKFLPGKADHKPLYAACGLSAVAVLVGLVNATIAYYAMWVLAIVLFAVAVYYTVKQL